MAANPETAHTATQIQAMVRNMDVSKEKYRRLQREDPEQYLQSLKSENEVLFDNYPAVFALHADDKLDETFFYMLQEKRKMEKGQTTEDEASVRVGQKLFNRWVAPIVNGTAAPESMSYAQYYKSLKKD
jgi:hypothetical protein